MIIKQVTEGVNSIPLGVLAYGNHTIWILYNETLDDGSLAFYNDFLNIFVGDDGHWVNLPDPLVLNDDDTIKFNFGEGVEGNISLYIDDVLYREIPLVNGSAEIKVDESLFDEDNKYGLHDYKIVYSGDATHDELTRNGTFNVTYIFKDNLVKEGFPLREYYIIIITLPGDSKGTVSITVNNIVYEAPVINGQAEFKVEDLTMGVYPVDITYSGDDKYPESSYTNNLNISYYGVFGEFEQGNRFVSLMLPENATGNLVVYNDNRGTKLYSKAIENGYARIDLNDLTIGIYELRAVYEGDDYDVEPISSIFKVMPYVFITQNATMDEDVEIFVDLDNSTGYLLIVMDGLSPVLEEIKDGKVNYTLSTKGYSYGNHTVHFQYFGESFDKNLFNEYDESTGKYTDPIEYDMPILGKKTVIDVHIDENGDIIFVLPYDATGNLSVDINGKHILDVDITNPGIYPINGHEVIIDYLNGKKYVMIKLSEDLKRDLEDDGSVTVLGSLHDSDNYIPTNASTKTKLVKPRIAVNTVTIPYSSSKKYSVTVYGNTGKVASGVQVKFLINNKAYKTVKTNAKGVASVVISKNPGSYKITSQTLGVSVTKKLTVTHIVSLKKVKVKKSAKKLVIKVTLKKVDGKYLKGKKITVKFNGKKFKAKTNKKGVAKVTIKQKVLKKLKVGKKVKYQATYKKDTVKKPVKVKK